MGKIGISSFILLLIIIPSVLGTSFASYNPHKIAIDRIESSGEINSIEEVDYIIVKKNENVVFVVPKNNEWPDIQLRPGVGVYGARHTGYIIKLESNDPNLSICYWVDLYGRNTTRLCDKSITTDIVSIKLEFDDSEWPKRPDSEYEIISNFIINGSIDENEISIYGTRYYDNRNESRSEYNEMIRQQSAYMSIFDLVFVVIIYGIAIAAVVAGFLFPFFKITRKVIRSWKEHGKIPINLWIVAYYLFQHLLSAFYIFHSLYR